MNLDLTPEFNSLLFAFQLIRERYETALMPDDKLELVAISKEIVREARTQIAQYRRAFTIEIYRLLEDQHSTA